MDAFAVLDETGAGGDHPRIRGQAQHFHQALLPQAGLDALPARDAELNGDYLQTLVRLYTMTGETRFLEWARRIGDAYVQEVLPGSFGVPAMTWDFEKHTGERRLRRQLQETDRLGRPRLTVCDLRRVGRRFERPGERGAGRGRRQAGEPLQDGAELERVECVTVHEASLGATPRSRSFGAGRTRPTPGPAVPARRDPRRCHEVRSRPLPQNGDSAAPADRR